MLVEDVQDLALGDVGHPLLELFLSYLEVQTACNGHKLLKVDLFFIIHIDAFKSVLNLLLGVILRYQVQVTDHNAEALHADLSSAFDVIFFEFFPDPLHHFATEVLLARKVIPFVEVHHAVGGFRLSLDLGGIFRFFLGLLEGDSFERFVVLL